MQIEFSDLEMIAARMRWLRSSAFHLWLVRKFGTKLKVERPIDVEVCTIYLFRGNLYCRREFITATKVDPMPPFKADYVEGGRSE